MSDEKRRRRWREAKYRSGERNPHQMAGRTNKSQRDQLRRQKEFLEKFGEGALNRLSDDRERLVVAAYFGLGGGVPTAGTIIARQLGTTRNNISRIVKGALKKLTAQEPV